MLTKRLFWIGAEMGHFYSTDSHGLRISRVTMMVGCLVPSARDSCLASHLGCLLMLSRGGRGTECVWFIYNMFGRCGTNFVSWHVHIWYVKFWYANAMFLHKHVRYSGIMFLSLQLEYSLLSSWASSSSWVPCPGPIRYTCLFGLL